MQEYCRIVFRLSRCSVFFKKVDIEWRTQEDEKNERGEELKLKRRDCHSRVTTSFLTS